MEWVPHFSPCCELNNRTGSLTLNGIQSRRKTIMNSKPAWIGISFVRLSCLRHTHCRYGCSTYVAPTTLMVFDRKDESFSCQEMVGLLNLMFWLFLLLLQTFGRFIKPLHLKKDVELIGHNKNEISHFKSTRY